MGVAKNFVAFPLSSLSEVGIRSCQFHMCGPVQSRSQSANLEKKIVSNPGCQINERNQQKFLNLEIGLAQDYGISSLLLGYRSLLGHKYIYELFGKTWFT